MTQTPVASGWAIPAAATGVAVRDGVRIAWCAFGSGPDVVLLPTWSIVPARIWKAQVPWLARHFRVTVLDGRGSGASDRPSGAEAYTDEQYAADVLAVMDDAGVRRAALVGLSCGAAWALRVAAAAPERVAGVLAIGPACGLGLADPARDVFVWDAPPAAAEGWATYNRDHWLSGPEAYHRFLEFFFAQMFTEPHSSKQIEDAVGWGHEISPQTLVDVTAGRLGVGAVCTPLEPVIHGVRCPVTVLHGTEDAVRPAKYAERLAELTGGELVLVEGAGHGLPGRDPVLVNREIRAFAERVHGVVPRRRVLSRAIRRPPRALYLSSPIGLGHARRDVAIADALRERHPDLRIDWLAQDPVTRLLATRKEFVHPASAALVSESAHVEAECGEHDLNAFAAIRRMDAILVANFGVLHDLVHEVEYDLVIADEAWEVDHFLHENPALKRFAFAWLTDFVGWLPMPAGGEREAELTADLNAEMLEHRDRFRAVRDRSVFVGEPGDVVDATFGPGLPRIRDWTAEHFGFAGYVSGVPELGDGERAALRRRLGYRDDERVCVVTVGGSAAGLPLLRRIADAVPALRRTAGVRVVLVTGPRIDPALVPERPGLTVHGWLPDLPAHLAACDVAVVQGGLGTCMELTANRRPFVYVPLRNHFEQQLHVRHRLERHRAGVHLPWELAREPEALAAAVAAALATPVDPLPVPPDGAARAAALLSPLLPRG